MELSSTLLADQYVTLGQIETTEGIAYGTLYSRLRRYAVPYERMGWVIAIKKTDVPKLLQSSKK